LKLLSVFLLLDLDPPTIMAMTIVGTLLMGVSLVVVSRGYLSQIKAVKEWGAATLIQTLGWLVVGALRGIIPDVISVVLGNALILLCLGSYMRIIIKQSHKVDCRNCVYAAVLLEAIILFYFVEIKPNVAIRIAIISLFCAVSMYISAIVLFRSKEFRPLSHIVTACTFLLCGIILTVRVFNSLFIDTDPVQQPFGHHSMNQIGYLTFYIISVMLTFGFILMCNDKYNAEREKIEEQLLKSKKRAEELTLAKDKFLSNMSHEIRTPLNGIVGFTKILLQEKLSEKQKHQVELIKTSSDILLVLINDLLDLTIINQGKMVLEKEAFHFIDLTNSIVNIFKNRAAEKSIELTTDFDQTIPESLIGDSTRISQILINLINNAIKFTNNGGQITVKVHLQKQTDEQATVLLSVIDNGIGINEQKLKTIFDPFVQDESVYKNEGVGLGLSIVKQLVTLMDGEVSIISKIKEGTTVNATLILGQHKKQNMLSTNKINTAFGATYLKQETLKVLLAEDNPINQFLVQTILEQFDIDVDTAENGKVAIEMLKKNTYDVVLMDLKMPEMDGLETSKYIRTQFTAPKSTIPIILITADATSSNMKQYNEHGINDFVTKPFNQSELINKITIWTEKSRAITSI
jgi:signal transduction histidine kinase/CheY-like chemotaxis protein